MANAPGKITLWGIEVFVATAEERSISAAARRLGASASAISQQLTNLEGALGAVLLDRGTRPLALTPAGAMFQRRAQSILNEAQQAQTELAVSDLAALTRLRLGVIEDFDADVTPALLSGAASNLPECRFLLETGASHRLFTQLDARALDVVIAADMGAAAEWMQCHPILTEPFVAVLPPDTSGTPEDLARLPLIQYSTRHHMGRQIAAHLLRQEYRLATRFELDSYHAIMAMVADGAGWSILTPLAALRARRFQPQVRLAPLPFGQLHRSISLVARRDVLGEIPDALTAHLRTLVQQMIVDPAVAAYPWLDGEMIVTA